VWEIENLITIHMVVELLKIFMQMGIYLKF